LKVRPSPFSLDKTSSLNQPISGVEGFIHVASPLGGLSDLQTALNIGRNAGLSALKACANTPSIKRFVNTSSSTAATLPKPHLNHDIRVDEKSYNDEAVEKAKTEEGVQKGLFIYAAMKSETEKAMWKWVEENKPSFVFNSIVSCSCLPDISRECIGA
jgi:hypothetical protein